MKKLLIIIIAMFVTVTTFAQHQKHTPDSAAKVKAKYSCPMHPEVTSNEPGKCSKCGMDLVKVKKEKTKLYSCPMHPEVTSDKEGKCSKCGMDLVKVKKEKQYTCPMHPEVTSDKADKCSKCGMDLVKVKTKKN